ncbi:UvrD-helicase domain-containing protein [Bacillus licheniformis]|uniref:UvrD-helicase domain-containing protein n=1 Tax=Bacillus licheniformis TaxID=1402 RepID=UPI0011A3D864|nr:UvrD-helicase domain-containing protein [Bacillus licheniformis]TWK07073.1 ATP-dependent DNA helicase Rep [Bacillus licheniformis]
MDKQIVLAAAGSGKTFYVANDFDVSERVILISFTNSNVDNIRKEVQKRFGGTVPPTVQILTFDSFVYNNLLKPFEPISMFPYIRSSGVDICSTPVEDPRQPSYIKKEEPGHFINSNGQYFVSRMGKLFLEQDKGYKNIVLARLSKYCDAIYFDEFQDYNGADFKTMKYLLEKTKIRVTAVGDIFQSCLTRARGASSPFNKINSVADLKKKLSNKIMVNESELIKSRRVPPSVCEFIKSNLGIKIDSASTVNAAIITPTEVENIHQIMIDSHIPKLIWDSRSKHELGNNYVNWTYSKGDTYSQSCVILTDKTSQKDQWRSIRSVKTRNALYVALTRSEGDLYLITNENYKKWRKYADSLQVKDK